LGEKSYRRRLAGQGQEKTQKKIGKEKEMIRKIFKGFVVLLVLALLAIILWPQKKYEAYQVSPEYQAQIDDFHIPSLPDGWEFRKFETRDGVNVRYGVGPQNPDAIATLIFMPGFRGTLEMYGEHLSHWQSQGYNVAGIDIRGQGGSERAFKSNPEKLWVKDFSVYSDDIAELLASEFSDTETPVILSGTSFGAHVAFRAASDHQPDIDGLLLFAPALRLVSDEKAYEKFKRMMSVLRFFNKSKFYAPGQGNWTPDVQDLSEKITCSPEPKRVYLKDAVYTREPDLRVGQATVQWLAEIMESGDMMIAAPAISKVNIPVMMVLGSKDDVVDNIKPTEVCGDLANCSLKTLEGSGHCILQEQDVFMPQIYQHVDEFAAHLAEGVAP
jgi:lysophospholipase